MSEPTSSSSPLQQPGEAAASAPYNVDCLGIPGVRFVPSDDELITHYLRRKLHDRPLPIDIVHVADVYAEHPRDLTSKLGESLEGSWYVFSERNRKYPKGKRPSRSTGEAGRWKATGKEEEILAAVDSGNGKKRPVIVGRRRVLAYEEFVHDGLHTSGSKSKSKRPTKKTEWKMSEFVSTNSDRPIGSEANTMLLNYWVLCKITHKVTNKEEGNPGWGHEEDLEPATLAELDEDGLVDNTPDPWQQATPYLFHEDGFVDNTPDPWQQATPYLFHEDGLVDNTPDPWQQSFGSLGLALGSAERSADALPHYGIGNLLEWPIDPNVWLCEDDGSDRNEYCETVDPKQSNSIGHQFELTVESDPTVGHFEVPTDPEPWDMDSFLFYESNCEHMMLNDHVEKNNIYTITNMSASDASTEGHK